MARFYYGSDIAGFGTYLRISTGLIFAASGMTSLHAEMYFPVEMLRTDTADVADLSWLRADGTQLPGVYGVDIYVNDKFITAQPVRFDAAAPVPDGSAPRDPSGLTPCLSRRDLDNAGVKVGDFRELDTLKDDECVSPEKYIPGLTAAFDFKRMRLKLGIPQIALRNQARGYIEPERWDEGINAVMMNYSFTGYHRYAAHSNKNRNYFLSLNGGVNLGPWRLRDYRNWSYYNGSNADSRIQRWQHVRTWVERTVTPLRSSLVIGESTTGSDVFDSLGFSGVSLATDDNMYPDALRGFAPVIRGTAQGNAEVTVRQNGYVIYRTQVTPGGFEINDLSPMYSSGDLEVSVKEAGGNVRVFTVPYSSVPALQREGHLKYSLMAGRFRGAGNRYGSPSVAQGTLLWGLPHNLTLYGGMQFSPDYLAVQSGAGVNMGRLGALSADVTHADSTLADGSEHQGQSLRLLYAQAFNPTGTTFRLTGYRYSTKGYHSLDETALRTMSGRLHNNGQYDENGEPVRDNAASYYNLYNTKRARLEANISQKLWRYGSVWFTGVRQTYWNSSTRNDSLQSGYSNTLGPVGYSVSYGYTRQYDGGGFSGSDRSISLMVSVPLSGLLSSSAAPVYATFSTSRDNNGNASQQAGMSGTLLEERNLNWNVTQGHARGQAGTGNASVNYRGSHGNASLGYSYGRDWHRTGYGLSGGVLLHENGLTLGQQLGDTSVLIATPGVSGISIKNEPGVRTDWRGYTVKPYATAYRENRIAVNTATLDDHTDVDTGVMRVVPTKGAVVRAEFTARHGYRVLLTLTHQGKPLPFGTIVTAGSSTGIVGDEGLVYLSGMPEEGSLSARWGENAEQQCSMSWRMTDDDKAASVVKMTDECRQARDLIRDRK